MALDERKIARIRKELIAMEGDISSLREQMKEAKAQYESKLLQLFAELDRDPNQMRMELGVHVEKSTGEIVP